jgi:hypothetical protein
VLPDATEGLIGGGLYPTTNVCSPVSSQLGAGHDRGAGAVDPLDDDRVRGVACTDRWDGLLLAHAPAGGTPRPAGWVAALTPLSADGMIVAASATLLADSRAWERGGVLPWALLVVGSAASLAANVAVAQPTAPGG